uniref:C-type lectin domain-containing protein n=1 Tax=Cyprinodon variegatus TaxID=28743 RepID=A0A3Q2DPE1_CYPVA
MLLKGVLGRYFYRDHQGTTTFFLFSGQSCFINCQLYEYLYINKDMNWTEAQQYCREKHTDLATVSNMTDMKRLNSTRAGYERDVWIGLYDQIDGDRTWYWSLPGVEFSERETKWNQGEPNDKGNGNENCGRLKKDLKWQDIGCQNMNQFLCYDGENCLFKRLDASYWSFNRPGSRFLISIRDHTSAGC